MFLKAIWAYMFSSLVVSVSGIGRKLIAVNLAEIFKFFV